MSLEVSCACGKRFRAKPALIGRTVPCPGCGAPLTINDDDAGDTYELAEEPDGIDAVKSQRPRTGDAELDALDDQIAQTQAVIDNLMTAKVDLDNRIESAKKAARGSAARDRSLQSGSGGTNLGCLALPAAVIVGTVVAVVISACAGVEGGAPAGFATVVIYMVYQSFTGEGAAVSSGPSVRTRDATTMLENLQKLKREQAPLFQRNVKDAQDKLAGLQEQRNVVVSRRANS